MRIAVIPIDNRPICYDLIKDVLAIDNSFELFMPDIKYLGGLTNNSNIEKIFEFLESINNIDCLIVSLDTIAYGGLVSSRRTPDSYSTIKSRIEKFKKIISKKAKKIYAFSSIMRISNNNINEEEKEYWSEYGKKIFEWSYNLHKNEFQNIAEKATDIPISIRKDYLKTRKRNFEINKIYLKWANEGFFDTLVYSKDDCAEFGLNVKEAMELEKIKSDEKLDNVLIKTGADEIPLSLISRAITSFASVKIKTVFSNPKSVNLISKYEDISVKKCVTGQLEIAGCKEHQTNYDLIFYINNFKKSQGDLVLGDIINTSDNSCDINNTFIADINNANGSDNGFVRNILKLKPNNFFGYCGYNTSANSIGASIFCAIVKYFAVKNNTYNDSAFKKYQLIRFMDDFGYQANIRKYVREKAKDNNFTTALKEKNEELDKFANIISDFLSYKFKTIKYTLPWNRSFEIRISIK